MTATTTKKSITTAGRATVNAVFADFAANPDRIARRGNSRRTLAFVPASHENFARLSEKLKPVVGDKATVGLMLVEWLQPHEDALSVSGYYLSATDELAPAAKILWVLGDDNGPDVAYLTRDGGALASAMHHVW